MAGGGTHDAIIGLAALEHDCILAARDARAKATYDLIGVRVEIAG